MTPKPWKVLICFGTRPEAIKLGPVVKELERRPAFETRVCVTAQHREMLDQVLELFEVVPHHDLDLMHPGQSLEQLTSRVVTALAGVLAKEQPHLLLVQGDTTTTFVAALAAFYAGVSVAHVEAGLRTNDKFAPFPEELNRRMTSCLADWHFAPTARARQALLREGVPQERIFTVGNTVIDALLETAARVRTQDLGQRLPFLDPSRPLLLVTGHRRESFGAGFARICQAIRRIALDNAELSIVYPVHLNPNVQEPVHGMLSGLDNVTLLEPLDYLTFVGLMERSRIILTDSGGIQEEAPSLGKPVLVMRETTERPEAVEAGVARLVGTDVDHIVSSVRELLEDSQAYERMSRGQNPYGDGTSSRQIADILEQRLA